MYINLSIQKSFNLKQELCKSEENLFDTSVEVTTEISIIRGAKREHD